VVVDVVVVVVLDVDLVAGRSPRTTSTTLSFNHIQVQDDVDDDDHVDEP
jgi:hypothetical protein